MTLDARQRAMLAEIGVRVWQPAPAAAAPATAAAPAARTAPAPARPPVPAPAPRSPVAPRTPAPSVAAPAASTRSTTTAAYRMNPPQALYPSVGHAPAAAQAHWLIVLDSPTPADPGAGDAGALLHKMLGAMQLHGDAGVFVSTVERARAHEAAASRAALAQALQTLRPAVVLALGLAAARALLDDPAPLEPLRAATHELPGGTPLVVSYAPAYLLRAPRAKAGAWADLQRAMALAGRALP